MYTLDDIKKEDPEIASAITDEFERQNSHIELIASENWVSLLLCQLWEASSPISTLRDIQEEDTMAAVSAWTR